MKDSSRAGLSYSPALPNPARAPGHGGAGRDGTGREGRPCARGAHCPSSPGIGLLALETHLWKGAGRARVPRAGGQPGLPACARLELAC